MTCLGLSSPVKQLRYLSIRRQPFTNRREEIRFAHLCARDFVQVPRWSTVDAHRQFSFVGAMRCLWMMAS